MLELDIRLPLAAFTLAVRSCLEPPVVAILGRSGSGKTSLLEAIAGLRRDVRGRIVIDGQVVLDSENGIAVPPEERKIGYVPQDGALFPHMTARANVAFGRRGEASIDALAATLEISHLLDRYPAQLSGGEKQRVALARALVTQPRLLLLDEPLAAVDQPLRERIVVYLRRIRESIGVPMIYVTHQAAEALALARTCLVLEGGAVIAHGPTDSIVHSGAFSGSEGVTNVFEVSEPRHDPDRGVTRVLTREGVDLFLPSDAVRDLDFPLTVQMSGEEIVIFTAEPSRLSARNVLSGTIESIEERDGMTDLTVRTPTRIRVRITTASSRELGLAPEAHVWLALRTRGFRVVG